MTLSRRDALRLTLSATAMSGLGAATFMTPPTASADAQRVVEVDVKDFGATGDGVTDDTASIHAARDAASVGGVVVVPEGTYVTTGLSLSVASQVWRIMRGATIKSKGSGSMAGPITVDAANVTITGGGTIDGNRAVIGGNTHRWPCITGSVNASDLTVDGITIQNSIFFGVWGQASRTRVLGCKFTGNYSVPIMLSSYYLAVLLGSTMQDTFDMEASDNFIDRTDEGISLINSAIQIRGNGDPAGRLHKTYRGRALRNTIRMPASPTEKSGLVCGIEFGAQSYYGHAEANLIVNGAMGISFSRASYGKAVGNTLLGQTLFAIEIADSPGVIAQGNFIDGEGLLGSAPSGCGITTNGSGLSNNVTIIDNHISGMALSATGITLSGGSRISVTGNMIESVNGIYVILVDDAMIGSNVMTGSAGYNSSYGVFVTDSQRITVSGNQMRYYSFGTRIRSTVGVKDYFNISNNSFRQVVTPVDEVLAGGTITNVIETGNKFSE